MILTKEKGRFAQENSLVENQDNFSPYEQALTFLQWRNRKSNLMAFNEDKKLE
jgi:hypothetical protein